MLCRVVVVVSHIVLLCCVRLDRARVSKLKHHQMVKNHILSHFAEEVWSEQGARPDSTSKAVQFVAQLQARS